MEHLKVTERQMEEIKMLMSEFDCNEDHDSGWSAGLRHTIDSRARAILFNLVS